MKELSREDVDNICNLYRIFGNVREVSKKSSISIGSIHKYLTLKSLIKTQNIVKQISNTDERLIGTYVGLWMGDGTQYFDNNYTVKICSNKKDISLNKFIQDIIFQIFGKRTNLFKEHNTNRAYIKFQSKFIFYFIHKYVSYEKGKKTYTAKLKKRTNCYSLKFREGCLLGLVLSDGYLKERFVFSVTSSRLAKNVYEILKNLGYDPKCSIQSREKYRWKNIYTVYLNRKESIKLEILLSRIIYDMGFKYPFRDLKYGPGRTFNGYPIFEPSTSASLSQKS